MREAEELAIGLGDECLALVGSVPVPDPVEQVRRRAAR